MRCMNIEAERARYGLTKASVASSIGVTVQTYTSYVSGSDIPSSKLIALADKFGVSCDYLLGLDREPTTAHE